MVFCFTGHTLRIESYAINNEIVNWNSQEQLRKEIPRKTRKKKIEEGVETVGKTWSDPGRKMEEIYLALLCGGPVFRNAATGIYSIIAFHTEITHIHEKFVYTP
jgi:hypothetical protein